MYREILCGPFEKDIDGVNANGFLFSRCDDMSNPMFKKRREEKWYLLEDGIFLHVIDDVEYGFRVLKGSFDPSKLDDYVDQMKQFKTEWMSGLKYESVEYDEEIPF